MRRIPAPLLLSVAAALTPAGTRACGVYEPNMSSVAIETATTIAAGAPLELRATITNANLDRPAYAGWFVAGELARNDAFTGARPPPLAPRFPSAGPRRVHLTTAPLCVLFVQAFADVEVLGPRITTRPLGSEPLSGDGDDVVEPGERWRTRIELANAGTGALVDGHAVVGGDGDDPQAGIALEFETPEALPVPVLAPGARTTLDVVFRATPGSCGARAVLRYFGAVDANAWSMEPATLLDRPIGAAAGCTATTPTGTVVEPPESKAGLFANPDRLGNGLGVFAEQRAGSPGRVWFGAWFTADENWQPVWYVVQGSLPEHGSRQARGLIYRFEQEIFAPRFTVRSRVVGTARATYLDADRFVFTWELDGRLGADLEQRLYPTQRPTGSRTGAWFAPDEPGWGQFVDDHFLGNAAEEVQVNYIYDNNGKPTWRLGATATRGAATVAQRTFKVHCPSCAVLDDFIQRPLEAGSTTRSYGTASGTLSARLAGPPGFATNWTRAPTRVERINLE